MLILLSLHVSNEIFNYRLNDIDEVMSINSVISLYRTSIFCVIKVAFLGQGRVSPLSTPFCSKYPQELITQRATIQPSRLSTLTCRQLLFLSFPKLPSSSLVPSLPKLTTFIKTQFAATGFAIPSTTIRSI